METDNLNEKGENQSNSPKTNSFLDKVKVQLKENLILVLTLIGIIGGIIVGFVGRIYEPSPKAIAIIGFPGEMLLRLLKMLILPLIISSLITGLAQLDPKSSGKMGSRAIMFYITSTLFSTTTGILFALIIRPGRQKITGAIGAAIDKEPISTTDALMDIIRNMFPDNIVQACTQTVVTTYKKIMVNKTIGNDSLGQPIYGKVEVVISSLDYANGTNVMGLVVFCTIFGIFISQFKSEAQVMYDFFYVMNELIMKIVAFIMWYSPVGILFLVAANILRIDNMAETAERLSLYMVTVIAGLMFHALVTMNVFYFLFVRKNPFKFLKGMLQAWLTAVGTASSSATLPITFRCLEENNKVDKRVTRFMLPLGATINMDGTALYQCVATVFIAQLNGKDFNNGELLMVILASTATSIGVASVPSAALVTMLIVLSTVGLPTENVSHIIAVDWLLDRLRTSINVLGDSYGCGIVAHLSSRELKNLDEMAEQEYNKILSAKHESEAKGNLAVELRSRHSSASIHSKINEDLEKNPSIPVMNAYRRHSKNLIFGEHKIPQSITSMPQISVYQAPNFNNQDTVL